MDSIRWGILGTARIAVKKVIPAMNKESTSILEGIASRSREKAKRVAGDLNIQKYYGSYDELLKDPDIDAVYNPLPNHLHVPWSIKALEAGKHVLCEKPIAMNADEAEKLLEAAQRYPELKVMEAFMYRHHPQWKKVHELLGENKIGQLQTIEIFFSYHNTDPDNIRNKLRMGGGALMDIGCYAISLSRFLFGKEPVHVFGRMKKDPHMKIDYLTSGIMDFEEGTATFTCSTQASRHEHVDIYGTKGRISMPLPFNPPTDHSSRIFLHADSEMEVMEFPVCNHYTIQSEQFSKAILNDLELPITVNDSYENMKAIDALRHSAITRQH